jgi:hypothetical protein
MHLTQDMTTSRESVNTVMTSGSINRRAYFESSPWVLSNQLSSFIESYKVFSNI